MKFLIKTLIKQISWHKQQELKQVLANQTVNILNIYQPKAVKMVMEHNKTQQADILIVAGLNNISLFRIIFIIYLAISVKTQYNIVVFSNPQKINNLLSLKSYQLISAQYFSFIPNCDSSSGLIRAIDLIGQRWLARFANCYLLVYKKS